RALPGTASDAEGESRRVGLVEPVPPALPGVTRQGQQSAARVAPGLPIDPDPGLVERAQTRKQRGACRLCATQRARDGRGHASSVGKLLYPGTQGWVRTDLEESPEAGLDELRYGGREAHRLAHVSAPVDCVEVAGFAPAPGDGRHQGQRRGPWTQCAERTH